MLSSRESEKSDSKKERKRLYNQTYRARQKEVRENLWNMAQMGEDKLFELAKEFLRTANSNPVIGMVASLIVSDVLFRAKIIDIGTAIGINVLVGTVEGSQITAEVLSDLTSITKFMGNSHPISNIQPSASTIVYADNSSDSQRINTLLQREGVKG